MKTKTFVKKSLALFMAVMMLMTAWVFVPGEHNHASAYPDGSAVVGGTNTAKLQELNGFNFGTGFTTVSGNFHGDNASTMASRGYYKNTLYSPHFPASNNNLNNSDAGVYFGNLGNTADGARVWYPETTLIWDGSTTPQIPILFDIDSNNNNRVGVKNVYISSGANGLTFKDSYWTAKSECAKDTNYYTHFTFDWIMQNNSGNYWISTSSGNDKESMCSSKGYWDIYGTYLQYTGGSFGSGSTYYKAITPTWVCRTGSNYTGTTNKTIYVIDYVPLKNALSSVQGIIDSINKDPGKYTTESVAAFVEAAKKLVAAKPNNYIDSSSNQVVEWNSAVSAALSAWNSAKNLAVQNYRVTFIDINGKDHYYTRAYGSSFDCASIASSLGTRISQHDDQYHQTYKWDTSKYVTTVTDDIIINEIPDQLVAHSWTGYTQGDANHTRECTVCGYVETKAHVEDKGTIDKEETCTEDGIKTYDCTVCGKTDIRTQIINNITGHDFTGDALVKEDGENGSHWLKCSRCDTYGWAGVADKCENHIWDKNSDGTVDSRDAVSATASTCTVAGSETYKCTKCPATFTKNLPLADHQITATAAKVVENICGGDGNEAFWSCSACKDIWTDATLTNKLADKTDADADGIPDALETKGPDHDFSGAFVNASNGADGTHKRQCVRFTQCQTYGPEEAHKFTSSITADSTCTVQGTKTYTCSDCQHSYTEKLPLAAHAMTKIEAVAATCTTGGNNEYYSCSSCKKYFKDADGKTETTVAAEKLSELKHTFIAGTDVQHPESDKLVAAATCMSPASYRVTCDRCGTMGEGSNYSYTYGAPDTVSGHKFNGEIKKNADGTHSYKCTVEGCTEYGNATKCEYEITADVASTCKTAGYTTYTCKNCGNGYSDTKTLDPNNHTGEGTYVIGNSAPTCSKLGSTGIEKCSGCNATLSTKLNDLPVDPANHENMKDYSAQDSTCQAEGWKAYKYCDACRVYDVEKVTVNKKDHKFTTYISNGNGTHTATCDTCDAAVDEKATDTNDCAGGTANCVDEAVCSTCNAAYGNVDSTKHKAEKTVAKVNSTCQTEGTDAYRYCEACDKALEKIVPIKKKDHIFSAWAQIAGEDKHTRSCTTCKENVGDGIATETAECSGGKANCLEKAVCTTCKTAYGSINPAKHTTTATTLKDIVKATCQKEGFSGNKHYNCCNAIAEAGTATAKAEHNFSTEVEGSRQNATCIATGEVTYECSTCDAAVATPATNKVILEKDASKHASTETKTENAVAVTCTTDGYTGDVHYVCCNALKQKGSTIKANGKHTYGTAYPEYMLDEEGNLIEDEISYEDKVAARDNGKWYHVQLCGVCGLEKRSACAAEANVADCVDTDLCATCGGLCSLKNTSNHKTALVSVPAKKATCTEDGYKAYKYCESCDYTTYEAVPATNHEGSLVNIPAKAATCTEPGWEAYVYCNECDYTTYAEIPAKNHAGTLVQAEGKAATCGEDGWNAYEYCTACDYTTYSKISATGDHTWGEWVNISGDCLTGVLQERSCTVCGEDEARTATDVHDYKVIERVEATAEQDGYEIKECAKCGDEVRVTLEYTGGDDSGDDDGDDDGDDNQGGNEGGNEGGEGEVHQHVTADENKYQLIEAADCKRGEIRRYTCLTCGKTFEKIVGEPQDHVWLKQAEEKATCTKEGHSSYYRCVRCLAVYNNGKVVYEPLGHEDADGNGRCDRCNNAMYADGEPDSNCGCLCHNEGWFMQIIYKIVRFFWKLFKISGTCGCGVAHY